MKYSLSFVSLLTPATLINTRLFIFQKKNQHANKILIKQSYLLLTWISYLQKQTTDGVVKQKPSFSFRPIKQSKITITKAPMAHKTFSQEQFLVRFFKLKVLFRVPVSCKVLVHVNELQTLWFL